MVKTGELHYWRKLSWSHGHPYERIKSRVFLPAVLPLKCNFPEFVQVLIITLHNISSKLL